MYLLFMKVISCAFLWLANMKVTMLIMTIISSKLGRKIKIVQCSRNEINSKGSYLKVEMALRELKTHENYKSSVVKNYKKQQTNNWSLGLLTS